jgi:hypothetical protein
MPSPHTHASQSARQLEQVSLPLQMPSPHTHAPQSPGQLAHVSPPAQMPLPQTLDVQLESQPSPFFWLPSSHCSGGASVTPSPQNETGPWTVWHVESHTRHGMP